MPLSLNTEISGVNISTSTGGEGIDIATLYAYSEVVSPQKNNTFIPVYESSTAKTVRMSNFWFWDYRTTDLRSGITSAIQYTDGDVYIGSSTSSNRNLYVYNDIGCKGTLSVLVSTIPSDVRLKENIKPIENALHKVKQLNGVYFNYKDRPDIQRLTGVIAQEVEKVIPEAVKKEEDNGYMSVMYGNLIGLLIQSIKELSIEVETLKNK